MTADAGILSLVIDALKDSHAAHCRVNAVNLSFAYMEEQDARRAVSARDTGGVRRSVLPDSPTALSPDCAGFNWFSGFPSNSSPRLTWWRVGAR